MKPWRWKHLKTTYLRLFKNHLQSSLLSNIIIHFWNLVLFFCLLFLPILCLMPLRRKLLYSIFYLILWLFSFISGTKKMEYKTRQWHEKCFSCCVCKNPIGTKSFIPKEQDIYCAGCYEEKFATRCIKCSKVWRFYHLHQSQYVLAFPNGLNCLKIMRAKKSFEKSEWKKNAQREDEGEAECEFSLGLRAFHCSCNELFFGYVQVYNIQFRIFSVRFKWCAMCTLTHLDTHSHRENEYI